MKRLIVLVSLLSVLGASAVASVGYNVDLIGDSNGLIEVDPTIVYYAKDFSVGTWLGIGNQGTSLGWFLGKTLLDDGKNSISVSIGNAYIGSKLGLSVEQGYAFNSLDSMFGKVSYEGTGSAVLTLGYRRNL